MNRKVLTAFLAVIAFSSIGTANATVYVLGNSSPGQSLSIGDIGFFTAYEPSGSFTDDFYFSSASISKLGADVIALGFSSLKAELIDTSTSTVVGSDLSFSLLSLLSFSLPLLADNNYELQVSGKALSPLGGIFTGGVHVSAVPIPAAAWLLLSGLVGVGAIARRRKS